MFCEWGCLTYLVFATSLVSVKISKEEAQDKVGDCKAPTQLAFTCSNLTIETLEQGVKYVQSSQ